MCYTDIYFGLYSTFQLIICIQTEQKPTHCITLYERLILVFFFFFFSFLLPFRIVSSRYTFIFFLSFIFCSLLYHCIVLKYFETTILRGTRNLSFKLPIVWWLGSVKSILELW